MHINVSYDASAINAPTGFSQAVDAAVQYFEATLDADITVNIQFSYGEVNGQPLGQGALAANLSSGFALGYADAANALAATTSTPDDWAALDSLPISDPTGGGDFFVTSAQAKALGLLQADDPGIDGYVAIAANTSYAFDPNHRASLGRYDGIGVIEHEISEVLGRVSLLGAVQPDASRDYSLLDLFRYSSPGVRGLTPGPGSFSVDGQALLRAFNDPANGGDAGDWSQSANGDAFLAFAPSGVQLSVSATDLQTLDVIGYRPVRVFPSTPAPGIATSARLVLTQDYQLNQGQALYFKDLSDFVATPPLSAVYMDISSGSGHKVTLTNSGQITYTDSKGKNVAGVIQHGGVQPFGSDTTFNNNASGTLTVDAGGKAWGYYSSWDSTVNNFGRIQVVSHNDQAIGAELFGKWFDWFKNKSSGVVSVWAPGTATGVDLHVGGGFDNAGLVEVTTSHSQAILGAIGVEGGTGFNNSGVIRASDLSGASNSVGVHISTLAPNYVNTGTIVADVSFMVDTASTVLQAHPAVVITNSGNIIGDIVLADGANAIHNTRFIVGDITFGDGDSLYDGASGRLFGSIFLGHAANTVRLGDNGGAVYGGGGSDTIVGGAGDDLIDLIGGDNNVDGGGGGNTLSFVSAAAGVVVDLAAGTAAASGADTVAHFQDVLGSGFDDVLAGDAADNAFSGLSGDDTLRGGAGDDTLDGGSGVDTASYDNAPSAVSVDLTLSGGQDTSGGGVDTLIGIEALTGSAFGDTLTGDGGANTLSGGAGDDRLDGGPGIDTAAYVAAVSAVTVDLSLAGAQDTLGAGIDTLISIESLTGSTFNDTLAGDGLANGLEGGGGNDTLDGGAGDDSAVYGGARSAYSIITAGLATIITDLASGFSEGTDTLTHIEHLQFADQIVDILPPAPGSDLTGDGKADILWRNANNGDVYLFTSSANAVAAPGHRSTHPPSPRRSPRPHTQRRITSAPGSS